MPSFAAPHFAGHFATPHFAAPHFMAPHLTAPHFAVHGLAPRVTHFGRLAPTNRPRHVPRTEFARRHMAPDIAARGAAHTRFHEHVATHAIPHRLPAHAVAGATAERPIQTVGEGVPPAYRFEHGHFHIRHFRRGFVGWVGPVFWPYAYLDIFGYVFWPYEYDEYYDLFWAYGYDALFGGIFLPYDYAALYESHGSVQEVGGGTEHRYVNVVEPRGAPAHEIAQLCGTPSAIAFPIAQIEKAVQPSSDQQNELDALKSADSQAEKVLAGSCSPQIPADPLARLNTVQKRIGALLQAVNIVRRPLNDFYKSLSDEQKARFNQLGETQTVAQTPVREQNLTQICGPQSGVPNFQIDRVESVVRPDAEQQGGLDALRDAANKAAGLVTASCPSQVPLTPPGRFDVVRDRLQAMLNAIETVRPPLQRFYASLSSAQKARFDAMNRQQIAQAGRR
jgi:hypothetical protein